MIDTFCKVPWTCCKNVPQSGWLHAFSSWLLSIRSSMRSLPSYLEGTANSFVWHHLFSDLLLLDLQRRRWNGFLSYLAQGFTISQSSASCDQKSCAKKQLEIWKNLNLARMEKVSVSFPSQETSAQIWRSQYHTKGTEDVSYLHLISAAPNDLFLTPDWLALLIVT